MMRSLLVKQFPDDLLRRVHAEAILQGMTVRQFVVRALEATLAKPRGMMKGSKG